MSEFDLVELIYRAAMDNNWQMIIDAMKATTAGVLSTHVHGRASEDGAIAPDDAPWDEPRPGHAYFDLIDQLKDGIILLDAKCRIRFCNTRAIALGRERSLCVIDRHGAMSLTDAGADRKLKAGLAAIVRRDHESPEASFLLRRADATVLAATLSPFVASDRAANHPRDTASERTPVALLTMHDRAACLSPQSLLSTTYGLTGAEAALALALLDGLSLKSHAEQRHISLHTVRNQLKSVFEKTGMHRQAELVALLSRTLD